MEGEVVSSDDRREPRLVTMQIPFRVSGPDGLILEGLTTGLNERGLAGRVNLLAGRLPDPPDELPVRIRLDLPREAKTSDLEATLLRVDASWVPGFTHFLAFHFSVVSAEDIAYFRRFIQWRDDAYFTSEKPNRKWYFFRASEQKVLGPLTTEELKLTIQRRAWSTGDCVWSPKKGVWIPFHEDVLEERLKGDESDAPPTGSLPTGSPAAVPTTAEVARKGRGASIALGLIAIILLAGGSVAFWTGWWDSSAAAQIHREAERLRADGQGYRALLAYNRLRGEHSGSRFASHAVHSIGELIREDRALIAAALLSQSPALQSVRDLTEPPSGVLLANDFDRDGRKGLELDAPVGAWTGNPGDPFVECATAYTPNVHYGDQGASLRIAYRVQSAAPGYAGAWMRLRDNSTASALDLSGFNTLVFMIRGAESDPGFTRKLRFELRTGDEVGSAVVDGITSDWKPFRIPLDQFALSSREGVGELRIVIESATATDQDGVLFVDDVQFEK